MQNFAWFSQVLTLSIVRNKSFYLAGRMGARAIKDRHRSELPIENLPEKLPKWGQTPILLR